jgi:toxin ParE1/3/4
MRRVTRTSAAERDLEEIFAWLLEHNSEWVDRVSEAFETKCDLLSTQPFIGSPRNDLFPGIRSVRVEWYIMFYEPLDDQILVHRIIHNSRNITPDYFPSN